MASSTFRKSFLLSVQFTADKAVNAVAMLMLARFLGPAEFGAAAVVVAPAITAVYPCRAFVEAVMRAARITERLLSAIFVLSLGFGVAVLAISAIAGPILGWAVSEEDGAMLAIIAALSPLALAVGSVAEGLLYREHRLGLLAIRKSGGAIVATAVAAVMASSGFGAISLAVFVALSGSVSAAIGMIARPWTPTRRPRKREVACVAAVARPTLLMHLFAQGGARCVEVMFGILLGPAAAGIVRISLQIVETVAGIIFMIADSLIMMAAPTLRVSKVVVQKIFADISQSMLFVSALVFVPLVVCSGIVIPIILGEGWEQVTTAIAILSLIAIPYSVDFPARAFLRARGYAESLPIIGLAGAASSLVFIAGTAKLLGIFASAGYVMGIAVAAIMSVMSVRRRFGISVSKIAPSLITPFGLALLLLLSAEGGRMLALRMGFTPVGQLIVILLACAAASFLFAILLPARFISGFPIKFLIKKETMA